MNYKKIVVKQQKAAKGKITLFEKAKDGHNRVRLSDYEMVVLSHSAN